MSNVIQSLVLFSFCLSVVVSGLVYAADGPELSAPNKAETPRGLEGIWNPERHISLDEVKPGMEAYCLTEYGRAGIEKFGLEVVDVVRDIDVGRDAIFVKGTDERFIHTGPVAGCSGSPVYVDERLAGALAFVPGGYFSKEPLYGVTPIEEMFRVGLGMQTGSSEQHAAPAGFAFDFSVPIDLVEVDRRYRDFLVRRGSGLRGSNYLPCPLITSGLPAEVCEQLSAVVEPFGFMVVAGAGGAADVEDRDKVRFAPGACLAIPLVSGDITASAYGTVTDVVGDKVYGLGHYLLGYGQVDLPMATGKIHTVVSSVYRSFKLGSVLEVVGALTIDEAAGVIGQIGKTAKTIPLTIRVDRYNDSEKRTYNCRLANNRVYTPVYLRLALAGAVLQLGDFPPDHMIEYKVSIGLEGDESVSFENVSTAVGLNEMMVESVNSVLLLMSNPFEEVDIESVDIEVRVAPRSIVSHIWSVDLSDSKLKAGERIDIGVVVESVLAGKKRYACSLEIPEDLSPGKYELVVCGQSDYEQFLAKAVPHRFLAQSLPDLIEALNSALEIKRNRLYCLLVLPPGGVTVEKAELPDLPATRTLVLQDAKRALRVEPYARWIEKSLETGTVVIDKKALHITVEE